MNIERNNRYLPVVRSGIKEQVVKKGHGQRWHKPVGDQSVPGSFSERKDKVLKNFGRDENGETSKKDKKHIRRALGAATTAAIVGVGAGVAVGGADKSEDVLSERIRNDMTPAAEVVYQEYKNNDLTPESTIVAETPQEDVEALALNGEMNIEHGTLTLHSGVRIRRSPEIIQDTLPEGDNSNIVSTVGEDNNIVVTDPIAIENDSGRWYGFTMAGEGIPNEEGVPTFAAHWVSADVLSQTNSANEPYADFVALPEELIEASSLADMTEVSYSSEIGFSVTNVEQSKGSLIAQAQIVETSAGQ